MIKYNWQVSANLALSINKMEKTQMINNQKEGGDITRDRTGIKVNS